MESTPNVQLSLGMMLALVACVAVNLWLFRVGFLWGILAVNVTKHVAIAAVCQVVGLNRKVGSDRPAPAPLPRVEPSANS